MPVAKLSREFYEKFGDKLTDELVNCLNSIEASSGSTSSGDPLPRLLSQNDGPSSSPPDPLSSMRRGGNHVPTPRSPSPEGRGGQGVRTQRERGASAEDVVDAERHP